MDLSGPIVSRPARLRRTRRRRELAVPAGEPSVVEDRRGLSPRRSDRSATPPRRRARAPRRGRGGCPARRRRTGPRSPTGKISRAADDAQHREAWRDQSVRDISQRAGCRRRRRESRPNRNAPVVDRDQGCPAMSSEVRFAPIDAARSSRRVTTESRLIVPTPDCCLDRARGDVASERARWIRLGSVTFTTAVPSGCRSSGRSRQGAERDAASSPARGCSRCPSEHRLVEKRARRGWLSQRQGDQKSARDTSGPSLLRRLALGRGNSSCPPRRQEQWAPLAGTIRASRPKPRHT